MAAKEPVVEPEVASPSSTVDNGEEQESPVQQSNNDAEVQLDSQMMTLFPNWVKTLAQGLVAKQKESQQQGDNSERAASLSNLASAAAAAQPPVGSPTTAVDPSIHPELQAGLAPGPNSHPNGPPSLGVPQSTQPEASTSSVPSGYTEQKNMQNMRKRGSHVGSEEWRTQRKINHKEVERRRRNNINFGIEELARIVPNGSGEKAKGAILSRSVQYIHHLKENEARNIEKWTLEKLLMDQAMGDLQLQLDEFRKLAEEERRGREKAEAEVKALQEAMTKMSAVIHKKRSAPDSGGEDEKGEAEEESAEQPTDADTNKSKSKKQKITA